MRVTVYSEGKSSLKNEDAFHVSLPEGVVVVDGATDKSGNLYEGRTGGEIAASCIAKGALEERIYGVQLVEKLNSLLAEKYNTLGISVDIKDAKNRFSASFASVHFIEKELAITLVGDVSLRLNEEKVFTFQKKVDEQNAIARADYIRKTRDIKGSRAHIMPLLLAQFQFQNNASHKLGYGVVDGTSTPTPFIFTKVVPKETVRSIEIFTDGYSKIPEKASIDAWEAAYKEVYAVDPYRCNEFPATKEKDDRTLVILEF